MLGRGPGGGGSGLVSGSARGRRVGGASESRYRRQGGAAEPTPISAAAGEGRGWSSVYKYALIKLEFIGDLCIKVCGEPNRGLQSSGAKT